MKRIYFAILILLLSLSPFWCWAGNSVELKRQVGTIPGLILIGILIAIQLNAFTNACVYYLNGSSKALVSALIPTVITFIVTGALTLLQWIYSYDITAQLLFLLFLMVIFTIIGLGRIRHAPTVEPDRFEMPPPFNDLFRNNKTSRQE